MNFGRRVLYTDEIAITDKNIGEIVRDAYEEYKTVVQEVKYLIDFEAGKQPILRKKTYRSDINCECVDNVANEVTGFNTGYIWGNPITFVQSGKEEDASKKLLEAVNELNRCYEAQGIRTKTQHLARNVEITGIGYTYVDINMTDVEENGCFLIESIAPDRAFIVRSSYYVDERPMVGVLVRRNKDGLLHFTCFTKDTRYELTDLFEHDKRSGEKNPIGAIPLVEWYRDHDRMGCFERQISEMNNLNLLISDFTNDVDQNTQAIWHGNDVDFPKELVKLEDGSTIERTKKPSTNDWMLTYTTQDGKQPFVKPLAVEYDYVGMLNNIVTRRGLILQKCNVPRRNDNSGGSTGIAMSDATGWSAAETSACKQQNIMESCKMEELKVVLKAIRANPKVNQANPLFALRYTDVKPNIKRQKTYELTVKVNGICALLSHGFSLEDAVSIAPLFEDPAQTIARSGEGVKKYQKTIFEKNQEAKEKRPFADYSDQENNSPSIGK